jgi:hypothetical protein
VPAKRQPLRRSTPGVSIPLSRTAQLAHELNKLPTNILQPAKFTPNRSSKTDCLNKIMQNQFMKKKKPNPSTVREPKKEFTSEANLLASYLGDVKIEEQDDSHQGSDMMDEMNNDKHQNTDLNEFIIPGDDYRDNQSYDLDESAKKEASRKNLKILIPQVTYKYIKDAMFPDSKVKDEKFLRSPYPAPEFGRLGGN